MKFILASALLALVACGSPTEPENSGELVPQLEMKADDFGGEGSGGGQDGNGCEFTKGHMSQTCWGLFYAALGAGGKAFGECSRALATRGAASGPCAAAGGATIGTFVGWRQTPGEDGHRNQAEHEADRARQNQE